MEMPEPGRQAAHVLVDAVSAHDLSVSDGVNSAAMDLALARLNEVGAVTATFDDKTDELALDISNLAGAALVTINWLVTQLALAHGIERDQVIIELRAALDE